MNSTNITDIMSYFVDMASKYNPNISKDTYYLSQFGFTIEALAKMFQNSVINANLLANEAFPILSQTERAILTNAVTYNVKDINAKPAKMNIKLAILEEDLLALFDSGGKLNNVTLNESVRIGRDCVFKISTYEYHLLHDIIITRNQKKDGTVIYTARYDLSNNNPNSDIKNVYINPPKIEYENYDKFLTIDTYIEQITIEEKDVDIITDNIVLNKTVDFSFESDMSYFTVEVTDINTGSVKALTPVVEGIYDSSVSDYCKYSYISRNKIRIKFDQQSYYPSNNSTIKIKVYCSSGDEANFTYRNNAYIRSSLSSDTYDYRDVQILIYPKSDSYGGEKSKSLEDIKKVLPREILGRNVITCEADLFNYFNKLDDNIVNFYKRRHNQIDHLYYAYLLSKDISGNVVPTNTVDIRIRETELPSLESDDDRYIIPAGTAFKMIDKENAVLFNIEEETDIVDLENKEFIYANPINLIINKDPISTSYYMDIINTTIPLYLNYINEQSINNFIVNNVQVEKIFVDSENYKFRLKALQTVSTDMNLVTTNKEGVIETNNVKSIIVIKHDNYSFYTYGELVEYDPVKFEYTFEYTLKSSKYIKDNKFKISDIYMGDTNDLTSADFPREVEIDFRFYAKFEDNYGADSIIPSELIEGYTLMNTYSPNSSFALYYNYSNIMTSYCKYDDMSDLSKGFKIDKVPMVKYSYIHNRDNCFNFVDNLNIKKLLIDDMLDIIIKPFGIDFKLYNTYGPSIMFDVGHGSKKEKLDRTNINLEFNVKLKAEASDSVIQNIITDIKSNIENLNSIDTSIHITNLTTTITNTYSSDIEFIEFVKFNNYDTSIQYLERLDISGIVDVPEFINIDLDSNLNPKIKINIL